MIDENLPVDENTPSDVEIFGNVIATPDLRFGVDAGDLTIVELPAGDEQEEKEKVLPAPPVELTDENPRVVTATGRLVSVGDYVRSRSDNGGEVALATLDGFVRLRDSDGTAFTRRASDVTPIIAAGAPPASVLIKDPRPTNGPEVVGLAAEWRPVIASNGEHVVELAVKLTEEHARRVRRTCAIDPVWRRVGNTGHLRALEAGAVARVVGRTLVVQMPDRSREAGEAALRAAGLDRPDELTYSYSVNDEVELGKVDNSDVFISLADDGSPAAMYKLNRDFNTLVRDRGQWRRLASDETPFGARDVAVRESAIELWDAGSLTAAAEEVAEETLGVADLDRIYVLIEDADESESVVGLYADRSRGRTYLRKNRRWTPADGRDDLMSVDVDYTAVKAWDDGQLENLSQVAPFDVDGDES